MRVKLSYSVDEENVLAEAAKILSLSSDELQEAVNFFNEIQKELRTVDDSVNINKCYEIISEFRKVLFNIDVRLSDVEGIIEGYDNYRKAKKSETNAAEAPPPPEDEIAWAEVLEDDG